MMLVPVFRGTLWLDCSPPCATGTKPLRVYLDGCFDVMHYGHANALRQARMLGDQLVVGLISDDEIRAAKGPPVMNYAERKTLVGSVKWVDEVIDGERCTIIYMTRFGRHVVTHNTVAYPCDAMKYLSQPV